MKPASIKTDTFISTVILKERRSLFYQKLNAVFAFILALFVNCQTFNVRDSKPFILPSSEKLQESELITLNSQTPDRIKGFRYTIDGTEPTCSSGTLYKNGISPKGYKRIRVTAVSCSESNLASESVSRLYTVMADAPQITLNSNNEIYISADSSAQIRYTVNGTVPSCAAGNIYSGPIQVGLKKK